MRYYCISSRLSSETLNLCFLVILEIVVNYLQSVLSLVIFRLLFHLIYYFLDNLAFSLDYFISLFSFQGSWSDLSDVVDLGRLELPTSRLSGVRSNLLSYRSIYILVFLRFCFVVLPVLRCSHTQVCSAPRLSDASHNRKNPAYPVFQFYRIRCPSGSAVLTYSGMFRSSTVGRLA